MLNRRILRIKAMQALYGYFTTSASLREMSRNQLMNQFEIDPARHDFAEKARLEALKTKGDRIFIDYITRHHPIPENEDADFRKIIENEIRNYEDELLSEKRRIKKEMIREANAIHQLYEKLLYLMIDFQKIEHQEMIKKQESKIALKRNYHLITNPVINEIKQIIPESSLNELSSDPKLLKSWYKEIIKKDDDFREYQSNNQPESKDHLSYLRHVYKGIIFKNEVIGDFFSSVDLYWNENKSILKSMINKTLKSYEPGNEPQMQLKELTLNKEDDFQFFDDLFTTTTERNDEWEMIIGKKARNWDMKRIAMMDMIIMKMALTEMITFKSIPVKVSINEYIELSKTYSTPKSKQFVNGILDVLANELTSEGVIRKTGRGLIDNK